MKSSSNAKKLQANNEKYLKNQRNVKGVANGEAYQCMVASVSIGGASKK